jgi:hypothetical protein
LFWFKRVVTGRIDGLSVSRPTAWEHIAQKCARFFEKHASKQKDKARFCFHQIATCFRPMAAGFATDRFCRLADGAAGWLIETISEAQNQAIQWLWTHNNERPNMAIGGITPAQKLKRAA